jgi:putative transposase
MEVSRSGYYRHLKATPTKKSLQEDVVMMEVKLLARESRNSYGSRMISRNLQQKGYAIGRYAARTLMRKLGIESKQRRRYRVTTQSSHNLTIATNVLNREFTVSHPNRVWAADITYLWTLEGWLYIAAVLDLFSRRVVGWAINTHMRESLVQDALQMAISRQQPGDSLMHHSDSGIQYASKNYQATLKAHSITVSMSRKGNCWDNSVMERFFGSLKSERTDHITYKTRQEAKSDIIDYIEMFYNSRRLHSSLSYVSPMQFEKQFLLNKVSTFT